jgi:CheY-like chemotaxis protein
MAQTLLVADDSITIQRVVDLIFTAQGFKVVAASDGEQAVEYLASARPDIALISVNLPKRDGFDVARFINGQPALHRLPVLLTAGAFDNVDDDRAAAVGASGVLFKPFEPGHVVNRVKELLGFTAPEDVPMTPPITEHRPATTTSHDDVPLHLEEWFTEAAAPEGHESRASAAGDSAFSHGPSSATSAHGAAATFAPAFGPAEAFAVLLAEEQGEPIGPLLPQSMVELNDSMIERIADRVAERLMHGVLGDSLRGTVHDVSERLVREEIQRIRAAAHTQR